MARISSAPHLAVVHRTAARSSFITRALPTSALTHASTSSSLSAVSPSASFSSSSRAAAGASAADGHAGPVYEECKRIVSNGVPAHLLKLKSAQRIFEKEAAEMAHARSTTETWKKAFFYLTIPVMAALAIRAYVLETEHMEHFDHEVFDGHKKFVPFGYLRNRRKPFPWADSDHSLFHSRFNLEPEEDE